MTAGIAVVTGAGSWVGRAGVLRRFLRVAADERHVRETAAVRAFCFLRAEEREHLVARGRKLETAGKKRLARGRKQVLAARTQTEKTVEDVVERARDTVDTGLGRLAQRLGIPQKAQIQALTDRVAELTRKIDSLQRAKTRTAAAR